MRVNLEIKHNFGLNLFSYFKRIIGTSKPDELSSFKIMVAKLLVHFWDFTFDEINEIYFESIEPSKQSRSDVLPEINQSIRNYINHDIELQKKLVLHIAILGCLDYRSYYLDNEKFNSSVIDLASLFDLKFSDVIEITASASDFSNLLFNICDNYYLDKEFIKRKSYEIIMNYLEKTDVTKKTKLEFKNDFIKTYGYPLSNYYDENFNEILKYTDLSDEIKQKVEMLDYNRTMKMLGFIDLPDP